MIHRVPKIWLLALALNSRSYVGGEGNLPTERYKLLVRKREQIRKGLKITYGTPVNICDVSYMKIVTHINLNLEPSSHLDNFLV